MAFLADRLAILMVIAKSRIGDWNPFFRDEFYDGEVGDEIREWTDYRTAKDIIRNMLKRNENGDT